MTEPNLNFVDCPDASGGHRMAYWQWGDARAAHVIVCAHGLSRQGRDFDVLAQALVARAAGAVRIVCPDVVGRGKSDWLKDPVGYQIPSYAADMLALLAAPDFVKPVTLDWVGTSMGGLIGMVICGQPGLPLPVPVRRLVLNDVGPTIQWQALQRIGQYLGNAPRFASLEQAAQAMWVISTGFGPHTPAQWLALSTAMVKPMDDSQGGVALHYDPAIAVPFRAVTQESAAQGEAALWQIYDGSVGFVASRRAGISRPSSQRARYRSLSSNSATLSAWLASTWRRMRWPSSSTHPAGSRKLRTISVGGDASAV